MGRNTRGAFHYLVGAVLIISTTAIGSLLTSSLTDQGSQWPVIPIWATLGIVVTFFYLRWQARSAAESPEAIDKQVKELAPRLREAVRGRSYGTRSSLIADDLKKLDLGMTSRVGWVRDHALEEPEHLSEGANIISALASSRRRLLIVGEPGSGKTMAAYALIEHLDGIEGAERPPLLVNLSAWEDQNNFEDFLIDYLCSPVGYGVSQPAVARAFVNARRYSLILDGLDEIPAGLREHFSERLDDFVRGLPDEVAVVVTCRSREYEELKSDYRTGLGLVQAVEVLPLTSRQLDDAFAELATKRGEDWKKIRLTGRQLQAYELARTFLRNPLFLNLTVESALDPRELLGCTEEQELPDLVLEGYLDHTLDDQEQYEPAEARRYLAWVARFLNGYEVSPFGLKTSDATVFDLANLTPPEPPRGYRFLAGLIYGPTYALINVLRTGLSEGLIVVLLGGLIVGLLNGLLGLLIDRLIEGLVLGLSVALFVGLNNGGWFVVLQRIAHRRLARAGKFPSRSGDFLEWGIERQIFRQVGGGVRFRHDLIQQHLASTSEAVPK